MWAETHGQINEQEKIGMQTYITPSKLYAYLQCQHRVWRDVYGPLAQYYRPVERVTGIGPVSGTWQAPVLPLNYTRNINFSNIATYLGY